MQSMATINPAQVALLKEMQPEFNFQERKLQPSADPAAAKGGDSLMGDSLEVEQGQEQDSAAGFSDQSMTDLLGLNGKAIPKYLLCSVLFITFMFVHLNMNQCMHVYSFI